MGDVEKTELIKLPLNAIKVIKSEQLFDGSRELVIQHGQEKYYLRLTNQGKLILTKWINCFPF